MGKLDGKVCVVTGASRGIGAEIARVFAAEGGKVVPVARTLHEGDHPLEGSLDTTVADIKKVEGFLSKPFSEALLYEMIDRVLRMRPVRPGDLRP